MGKRKTTLRDQGYGGAYDWVLIDFCHVKRMGDVERRTHQLLAPHAAEGTYWKDEREQAATELFQCSFSRAKAAVHQAAEEIYGTKLVMFKASPESADYEFEF